MVFLDHMMDVVDKTKLIACAENLVDDVLAKAIEYVKNLGFESYRPITIMDKMTNLRFGKELVEEIFKKAIRNIQENEIYEIEEASTASQEDMTFQSCYDWIMDEDEDIRFKREEEEEQEIKVIQPDYDATCEEGFLHFQSMPKQRTFWSSGDDTKMQMPEIPAKGGRGDVDPPSCSSQESQNVNDKKTKKKYQQRQKNMWKLGNMLRHLFHLSIRRNSKSSLESKHSQ